jgi:polysaccharide deacetylase family protein (PEP-CTERM system associated)
MRNALSIDLEDWFCANNLGINIAEWDLQEQRVIPSTNRLLELLAKHNVKATFFVLGWLAEREPDLIRSLEQAGHEIATHGYSHTMLTLMTPESFDADIERALQVTQACVQQPILGFRAPSFTVTANTLWALDILSKHGIQYDSSIFPIGFHPDYGLPDANLGIHQIQGLIEVPMSVAEVLGRKIPCSGGGYFRLMPYRLTTALMHQCNRQGRPVIFYLHPWEIDPDQPRQPLSWSKRLRHYVNLDKTLARLDRLIREFEFAPIKEIVTL